MGEAKCNQCEYSWRYPTKDDVWVCDYIGCEHKRRPCPFGAGCTVFKQRTRNKFTGISLHEEEAYV